MNIKKIEPSQTLSPEEVRQISAFLHEYLDQFADTREQIKKCLQYAQDSRRGGVIYVVTHDRQLMAVSVVLNTQMEGFIPPYVLVYIAVSAKSRGQGIGKRLLEYLQEDLDGDICLHCDHDNPAKRLYEKVGFESKYLEMRWQR